ncbi:protein PTHB1-like [Haliotis cracherodii]|uniref:protein PTHB1-like n=1 Tax=Haliotis cracherodii TaxID=6455 RepID=UPI0039EB599F
MSLFKIRDWWSTTVGEDEEFDQGCLCVANIDNSSDGIDKIILGSYNGILRIFNPSPTKSESGSSGYKAEDVMLEHAFPNPILQVEAGKFSSGSENLTLAILHPRKISVLGVSAISGSVGHGSHYQIQLLYEHSLQRTAFNFCFGPFGGVKGRDFLCVQSMDGTVSIFEQESFAFSRFLPGALLPGPIKYMSRTDSFITVSSMRQVESYKYQVLAVASDSSNKEESQNLKSGKKVAMDWAFNIGEQAIDISVISFQQTPPCVMVLGERNLFCLTDSGKLRYMKKFEFDPACFVPYTSITEGTINYMVATHTSSLMIYQDVTLKWAAKMEHIPVHICTGNMKDLKGVMVSLSDSGRLECGYLGTDPAIFVPPTVEARELNYADMDGEMRRLQKKIKDNAHKSVIVPNLKTDDDLTITIHVNPALDDSSMAAGVEIENEDIVPSITARIQLKSRLLLDNVRIEIHTNWPLAANQTSFTVPSVDPNKPTECFCAFFMRGAGLPAHLSAEVSARYTSASGAPRVSTAKLKLPFDLVVKPVFPVKVAVHKLTIDTNKPPVNLNELFPDLLGENAGGQGAALGFQFYGGPVVTVLASKTSQRYRLQCDQIEALWLPMRELAGRLSNHFNRAKDFKVFFDGALPLQEYFNLVDVHFEFRLNAEKCKEVLEQRAQQFRMIQKRLLTKFKDKTPSALQNMDTLLEGTFRQIIALADGVEENRRAQEVAATNLSSATHLLNFLIKIWTDMTDDEFQVLESAVSPIVNDSEQQGWQEMVDAAVTHLLRTTLAKSAKDQTVNPSPLTVPQDTTKVKKHIALLCDRLGKGVRLVEGLSDRKERKMKLPPSNKSITENGETDSLIGDTSALDSVVNTKYKDKKKKKKHKRDEGMKNGRTLNDLEPMGLPVMDKPNAGMLDSRKQQHIEDMVPDLGDMDGPNLSNGNDDSKEVVYAL